MHAVDDVVTCGDLADPGRLAALAEAGLGPRPDPDMEWYAERVRRWLDVPVALVSLVRPDEQVFPGAAGLAEPYRSTRRTPLSHSFCQHVVLTGTPLVVEDSRDHPLVRDNLAVRDLAVVAYAGMPLTDAAGNVLGSLCAIDVRPRRWRSTELDALADLAAGCATELRLRLARRDADEERARRDALEASLRDSVERSVTVAREMQLALLTTLPAVPGLEFATRYAPADAEQYVGGDWFDVLPLVGAAEDSTGDQETVVVVSVGDIVGHELDAAITMGQVRSMLRQAAWDRAAGPPSAIVAAFERANAGIGLDAAGTTVVARLRRRPDGQWAMSWVNAGHPPPLVVTPDGRAELLEGHGRLFGLPRGLIGPRRDQELVLPAGSLLFLHSDGLVEGRGTDADERTETLRARLADLGAIAPDAVVDTVMAELPRSSGDDVVAMALRLG
ncbi:PP2C family protein-serine/threonine phosphatase [Actinomycetospora straminea]|uniref:Serine phosphatase RsbU (Regulator of sigma subunit) n=1 Tax=Actinomycetospora straminea TaxID=663607 RepID=A0ABP9DWT1_9PSEU|nr:GAF domain-containing SpoIIE family protein phosphatase [Actinomycetospora straminea]MDD7934219.1 SpoIIE family protein phosphatase [Actinomycetospora straminea]